MAIFESKIGQFDYPSKPNQIKGINNTYIELLVIFGQFLPCLVKVIFGHFCPQLTVFDLIWTKKRLFDVLFIPESYQAWVNIAFILGILVGFSVGSNFAYVIQIEIILFNLMRIVNTETDIKYDFFRPYIFTPMRLHIFTIT